MTERAGQGARWPAVSRQRVNMLIEMFASKPMPTRKTHLPIQEPVCPEELKATQSNSKQLKAAQTKTNKHQQPCKTRHHQDTPDDAGIQNVHGEQKTCTPLLLFTASQLRPLLDSLAHIWLTLPRLPSKALLAAVGHSLSHGSARGVTIKNRY